MKKYEIWLVEDKDCCCDANTGEAVPFLTYDTKYGHDKVIRKDAELATLDELAALCDSDAENSNNHSFVGVHAELGKIMVESVGEPAATDLMRRIAYRGGLHEMLW